VDQQAAISRGRSRLTSAHKHKSESQTKSERDQGKTDRGKPWGNQTSLVSLYIFAQRINVTSQKQSVVKLNVAAIEAKTASNSQGRHKIPNEK